ncbi:unnamed protein product [Bathycoccus prasinos]
MDFLYLLMFMIWSNFHASCTSLIPGNKLQFGSNWSQKFCNWGKVSLTKHDVVGSRNLVIGMALGPPYTIDKLLPFCKSLRLAGFQGKVILGVTNLKGKKEKERMRMFDKFNVTGIYLDRLKSGEWGQSICRYHAYLKLILHFATKYDSILVSDVRDVFFQANPFSSHPFGSANFLNSSTQLLLFSEGLNDISTKQATLRNTRGNFRWLTNIYGYKKSNLLRDNPVLCSGTTLGTKAGMVYYTRAMLYEAYLCLKRNPKTYDGRRGHVCSGGADQGFHNYLFWNNMLNASVALLNAAGPVYTVGIFRGKPVRSLDFERNTSGDILSPLQRGLQYAVPVIHQWDRHSDLLEHVFSKFDLSSEGVSKKTFRSHLLDGSFSGKSSRRPR